MVAGIAEARGMETEQPCYDEYEKLVQFMNTPRVDIDNSAYPETTLVKVDGAKEYRFLLKAVQVLSDLNLVMKKAHFSSDGGWFMDAFHVTDQFGCKLTDKHVITFIEETLQTKCLRKACGQSGFTVLELSGVDRPGLVSEIFAVLADHSYSVSDARFWTHNGRMAAILSVSDIISGEPLDSEPHRIPRILHILRLILCGRADIVSSSLSDSEQQLHKIMYSNRDFETPSSSTPAVSVQSFNERGYSLVSVQCPDRPKLLFDIICALTDMEYIVFHGNFSTEGDQAHQEFYIKNYDGNPISSDAERERVAACLQAAVERRGQGLRLEVCSAQRQRILPQVTRVIREHGLLVKRAEVLTKGQLVSSVFYLTDSVGGIPSSEVLASIRLNIGIGRITVEEKLPQILQEKQCETKNRAGGTWPRLVSWGNVVFRNLSHLGLVRSFSRFLALLLLYLISSAVAVDTEIE